MPREHVRPTAGVRESAVPNDEAVRELTRTVTLDESGPIPDDLADGVALDAWLRATVSDYVHAWIVQDGAAIAERAASFLIG
jgi:hypothetical protein